ncbi:MAG: thioredoxin [Bacteroidota bacterium]
MMRFFFLLICLSISISGFSQYDPTPPYQRFPTYPPVNLLMTDSATLFTKKDLPKKTPVLLIIFNPECDHCQHETTELIKNINSFKKVKIVMATVRPIADIKPFVVKYKLAQYSNITVGKDFQFFLPGFYMINNLPYLAMYDKQGKLISTFEGTMKMTDLIKVFE